MARRLTREERQLLEENSLDAWLAQRFAQRPETEAVELPRTPEGWTPFSEEEEETSSLWRQAADPFLSLGGMLMDIGGTAVDTLSPDPHNLALGSEEALPGTEGLPDGSGLQSIVDTALALPSSALGIMEWAGLDRPGRSLGITQALESLEGGADPVLQERLREAERIAMQREAAGLPSAEELRQQSPFNQAADFLYDRAERAAEAQSPELLRGREAMGQAVEGGMMDTLRFLGTGQGVRTMLTGVIPEAGAYALPQMGIARGVRAAGASQQVAQTSANMMTAYTVAQQNAREIGESILSLSPEEAMQSPAIAAEYARLGNLDAAKSVVASRARMEALAGGALSAPLYSLDSFSRAGAGVRASRTATLPRRVIGETGREVGGEVLQGGSEALIGDLARYEAGLISEEDIGRTVGSSALLEGIAAAPLAGGMSYGQARSDFNTRADLLDEIASRLENVYAQREGASADAINVEEANANLGPDPSRADPEESVSLDREPIRPAELRTAEENAAEEAMRLALSGTPVPARPEQPASQTRPLGRDDQEILNRRLLALEPENEAEQEAWRLLQSVPTGRDLEARPLRGEQGRFTGERFGDNLNELARDERGRLLGGTNRDRLRNRQPTEEEMLADNQRQADALVAEQQAEAEGIDAGINRQAVLEEARAFEQEEAARGDEAARTRLANAKRQRTIDRKAAMRAARDANADATPEARAEAIADAAEAFDAANPIPTLETLPPEAPRARGRAPEGLRTRNTRRPQPRTAPPPAAPEAAVEASEEAPVPVPTDRRENLRARYGRSQDGAESTAPAGKTAAEVIRTLSSRVRRGTDRSALEAEVLLSDGKLSIVDPEAMATVGGAAESTEGFYDGERMYINAAALPEGDPVGVLFDSVLAHEANHAATFSQNPDAVSKASVLLEEAPRARLIEQLETATHPTAVAAREAVAARGIDKSTDPARYEDEIIAYAINHAIETGGRSWAPIRGVVSAARRKWNEFTGSDNLNLDDLGHYARATVNALAESDGDIRAPGVGRAQDDVFDRMDDTQSAFRRGRELADQWSNLLRRDYGPSMAYSMTNISPSSFGTTEEAIDSYAEGVREWVNTLPFEKRMQYEPVLDEAVSAAKAFHLGHYHERPSFEGREQASPEVAVMQAEAEQMAQDSGLATAQAMVEGTPTRTAENVMLPVELLQTIPGTIDESRGPGDGQYDQLLAAVESDGYRMDRPIDVRVNHRGEPYIVDGNTRVAVAAERGVSEIPANVQWMNGAENVESSLSPAVVESRAFEGRAQEGITRAADAAAAQSGGPYVRTGMDRLGNALKNAATVHGTVGENVGRLIQEANYSRDAILQTAVHRYHRVGPAIERAAAKALAGEQGSVREKQNKFNDQILDRLNKIAELPSEGVKDKALARMVQEHPDLAPLVDAIHDINKMTDTIIASRFSYADAQPLTEQEWQLYDYMDRNKYSYFTNVYAAFQGKEGKKYADAVLKAGRQGIKLLSEGKDIPANLKGLYKVYDDALSFVLANDIAVSDPEQLAAMSLKDVSGLYDTWMPDGMRAADLEVLFREENNGVLDSASFKAYMEDAVAEHVSMLKDPEYTAENGTTGAEILRNQADATIAALLDQQPLTGPAARYGKARGIDMSLLQHRKDLPPQIAALYGQVKDIPSLINATLTRQGELASRLSFFNKLADEAYGEAVISAADRNLRGNQNFTVPLSGPTFGRLNGMYTTPEMAQRLADYNTLFTDLVDTLEIVGVNPSLSRRWAEHKLGKGWTTGAGIQKAMKIITRPDYTLLNLAGSFSAPVLAGGVKPAHLLTGMKVALEHIALQIDPKGRVIGPELSAAHQLALQTGAFDNAVTQELRRAPRKLVNRLLEEMTAVETVSEAWTLLKRAGQWSNDRGWQTLVESYSLADTWVKLPVLLERMDYLEAYHNANGDSMTREQLVEDAARFMRDATISMDNVPGFAKFLEKSGMTFYLPYFASVFRVLHKSNVHIVDSLEMAANAKTPEARWTAQKDAARKLGGVALVWSVAASGLKYVSELGMEDDDLEQMERDRELMFDEAKYGDLFYLGENDQGHRQYFLTSRTDQFGPAFDLIRQMQRVDSMEEMVKAIPAGMWDLLVANRLFGATLEHVARGGKNTQLERAFPEATQFLKDQANRVGGHGAMDYGLTVADLVAPAGVVNYFDPRNKTPAEVDGDAAAIIASIAAATGHRLITVNPEAALGGKARELSEHRREANSRIRSSVQNSGPMQGYKTFLTEAKRERALTEEMGKAYHAMLESGMSPRQLADMMDSLDATALRNIRNQAYTSETNRWIREYSGLLSSNSINNPPEYRDLPEAEREEAQREWKRQAKEVKQLVEAMRLEEKK